MKPSFGRGAVQDLTPVDLLAFDVMGYNLVPEPSAFTLAALAGLALFAARFGQVAIKL